MKLLSPSKHSHPDQTIISVTLKLLSRIKSRRVENYDSLRSVVKDFVSGGDALFLPSLSLLFLLGLVEYRPKTDSIEYVGPNEAD
jgi:ABC-three component (ABC-3C) system Middle Component 8